MSSAFLEVLEKSAPKNMECVFISCHKDNKLVGIILSQFVDLNKLESFGERDKCIKTSVRNFMFKNFCSHVLFIGNNMLTGQNAFSFSENCSTEEISSFIQLSINELKIHFKDKHKKVHLCSIKDFETDEAIKLKDTTFNDYYPFSTQPNMIFEIKENWKSEEDYVASFSKKYRDQYKRARKKCDSIEKRKLSFDEIILHEDSIYDLYFHVAKNAPFNTFFLAKNHFCTMKALLKDNFLFYGYFLNGKLVGFNTLIKNGASMDTYFLGYDNTIQKEKMLYLNMLYDMVAYSIKKGFKEIIFGRTALEIKSSIGAKPREMKGFIKHEMKMIDQCMSTIFNYLEPKTEWNERNPFK